MSDAIGSLVVVSNDGQQFGMRFASWCRVRFVSLASEKDGKLPSGHNVQVSFGIRFAGVVMGCNCKFCFGYMLQDRFWIRFASPYLDEICGFWGGQVLEEGP